MTVETTNWLNADAMKVYRNDHNNLCVELNDTNYEKIAVNPTFPYSAPDKHLAFVKDEEEIGILPDLTEIDDESQKILNEAVAKRCHIPEIERIVSIEEVHNGTRWTVETDSGTRDFEVQDRHNFRRIREGGLVIVDVDANRFRISDVSALDEESHELLDRYY